MDVRWHHFSAHAAMVRERGDGKPLADPIVTRILAAGIPRILAAVYTRATTFFRCAHPRMTTKERTTCMTRRRGSASSGGRRGKRARGPAPAAAGPRRRPHLRARARRPRPQGRRRLRHPRARRLRRRLAEALVGGGRTRHGAHRGPRGGRTTPRRSRARPDFRSHPGCRMPLLGCLAAATAEIASETAIDLLDQCGHGPGSEHRVITRCSR